MKNRVASIASIFICVLSLTVNGQQQKRPAFHVLALADKGGGHVLFSKAGHIWLEKLAADSNFSVDYISDPSGITKKLLKKSAAMRSRRVIYWATIWQSIMRVRP